MVKTLTKHGNSYALVIERPIMELLCILPGTPLEISTDGKSLIIRPVDTSRRERFRRVLDETCEKHHDAFGRLAQ